MAHKNIQGQIVAQQVVTKRILMSAALLDRMGVAREVFERVALNALLATPALAKCSADSLDAAFRTCIEWGLMPDKRECVIVPFKETATPVPMIEGRIKLARAASPGLTLRTRAVFTDDDFQYEEGLYPVLKHIPKATGDRGDKDLIAVYAVCLIPQAAAPEYEVFMRGDVLRYKGYALSVKGPWSTHFIEMAKKAVLGQLLKRLPKAVTDSDLPEPLQDAEVRGLDFNVPDTVSVDLTPDEPVPGPIAALPSSYADPDTGEIDFPEPTTAEQETIDEVDAIDAMAESDGDNTPGKPLF